MSKTFIVIATKGRSEILPSLLENIEQQTQLPEEVVFVGSESSDVSSVDNCITKLKTTILISDIAGASIQRNVGIQYLENKNISFSKTDAICFFDDDFRLDSSWLEKCLDCFNTDENVHSITGLVLADGVNKKYGISESEAVDFIANKKLDVSSHRTHVVQQTETKALYGCNMAIRANYLKKCKFDQNLPAYSWQEDRDITGQLSLTYGGRAVIEPNCIGVHLGTKGGRTSGIRFGYSQVSNLVYLWKKGTIDLKICLRFIIRNFLSNVMHSVLISRRPDIDYRGRLFGNYKALLHLVSGKVDPKYIEKL